ncbi:hypothetical protein [Terribacillus sp. 7520-G]|uniref:hypothetical protein n=1 Tax=Terribacillus sp. 7520-G TaxID=2025389 RepID=UPI001180FA92|nr:hypothetical protein [Terribacillus sp. 7520-G]
MIKGISYITFIVRDLNRTADLFQKVLDAEEVYGSGIKSHPLYTGKLFHEGGQWIAVMQPRGIVNRTYHHAALK